MINTSKLLSKRTSRKELLSREGVTNLIIIKKNVVKIDGLLKERLVLSKVREGLLKQQRENERRRERERQLEAERKDDDTDVNPKSKKKPKSMLGGILKAILGGFLKFIGKLLFRILPRLPFLIKAVTKFSKLFLNMITGGFRLIRSIVGLGAPLIKGLGGVTKTLFTSILGVIKKGTIPLIGQLVNAIRGIAITASVFTGTRGLVTTSTRPAVRPTVDAPAKLLAQREIRKKLSKNISNRQILDRFGVEDVLTDEGRRITKARQPIAKSATTGFAEPIGRRIVVAPKKGEREASQKLLESLLKKQNNQLNLFSFLAEEPTRINDIDFKNLKDFTDGKISDAELDAKILRQRGLDKVDLDNIKLGNVRQRADITKILNKSVGTKTKARDLARQQRNINKILKPKKGEIEASQKLIENLTKKSPEVLGKKGLAKFLTRAGGETLEQSVKQSIKASIGLVPILGDVIGVLIDHYVFGEPVGRAAFKGIGSFALGALFAGVGTFFGGPIGALLGSIVGGIGGDILGGIAYDLFFGRKPQAGYSTVTGGGKEYLKGVSKARSIQKFEEGGLVREYEPLPQIPFDKSTNLRSLAFYEKTQVGREVMVPIPIPIPSSRSQSQGSNIVVNQTSEKRTAFSQHYRRG